MQKELIKIPVPERLNVLPFSQAIKAGGLLFIAAQAPIDPKTGKLVKGTIQQETTQVLENIKRICELSGTSLDNVVKVSVFMRNWSEYAGMNEVRAKYFGKVPPVSTAVEVSDLYEGIKLEMEAIAVIP